MSTATSTRVDYFRTPAIYQDPYPYYEYLRAHGPVWREPHWGVVMITGFEEAMAVYNDTATFSSCNTVAGPFVKFPVAFEGDDISAIIEEHRDTLPFSDQLPSFDPPKHTEQRALLLRLITPKRLKENEEFMWQLADRQIDEFVARGRVRVRPRLREAVHAVGDRRPARRPGSRSRNVPRGAAGRQRPRRGSRAGRRCDGAQAVGVPLRAVHRVHRGAAGASRATT